MLAALQGQLHVLGGLDLGDGALHVEPLGVVGGVGLVGLGLHLAVHDELVVVQVARVAGHAVVAAHVLGAQALLAGHQGLEQLLTMTGADDVRTGITKQLLDCLCQIADGGSIRLLDEQITGICMLESEQDQIHSLVQVHQKAGHVGVSDSDGVACLDLVDEQRNNGTTAAHDVAITGAADGRAAPLGSHTGIGVDNVLHHGFGDAHSVDGVGCLIGGQADNTLDPGINSGVKDIVSTDDVSLDSLHGEELTGRNLLQSSSVEDVVNAGHSVTDGLRIADITDVELDLLGGVRVLGLKFVAHIILFLFVPGEDADFLEVRIKKVLQNGRTKRTSTTSDHKGCVIKCRHCYFLPFAVFSCNTKSCNFFNSIASISSLQKIKVIP